MNKKHAKVEINKSFLLEKGWSLIQMHIRTIYHLALENESYYNNYGIYANGLLVESCSQRYLKELSNMELI